MNEFEIFRCPLFPVESIFTDSEFRNRVSKASDEISVLLDEVNLSNMYEINYEYSADERYLWMVAIAKPSIQRQLDLSGIKETIAEFKARIQQKVGALPIVLNSLAFDLEASVLNRESIEETNREISSLVLKNQGKQRIFKLSGRDQLVLFPQCSPFRIDPHPREIMCKVLSLSRFEAKINCIDDKYFQVKKNVNLPLLFRRSNFEENIFFRLAEHVHSGIALRMQVDAMIEILTGSTREYHLKNLY